MANLSLGTAWNEAAAFVAREARLLFPIAFVMVALPAALLSATMPQAPRGQLPPFGAWVPILVASFLLGFIGQIALSYLAVRGNASVGEALARGAKRLPSLLIAILLLGAALGLVAFATILVALLLVPGLAEQPPSDEAVRSLLIICGIVLLPIILYFGARLVLLTPVAAAEEGGPLAIIRRSWALTAGKVWQLIGFLLMIGILVLVVNYAVATVGGIFAIAVAGPIEPGSLSKFIVLLIGAVLQTVITVYMATLIARVYAQLDGAPTSGT